MRRMSLSLFVIRHADPEPINTAHLLSTTSSRLGALDMKTLCLAPIVESTWASGTWDNLGSGKVTLALQQATLALVQTLGLQGRGPRRTQRYATERTRA